MNTSEIVRKNIFKGPRSQVWYYPNDKIVHHQFTNGIHGEDFKNTLNIGLVYFKKNGCTKYLSDDRLNLSISKEDMEWVVRDWNPRVLDAGWKFWAIVMPDKATNKLGMNRIIEFYKTLDLTIKTFDNVEEALLWLVRSY